jgi:mannose-6-phosphate isomerase-like protein (cupin superfamily)
MESLLDRLLQPVGRETFLKDHLGTGALHIKGSPELVRDLMSWEELSRLLSVSSIWSPFTLRVYMDRKPVPVNEYCSTALSLTQEEIQRPDSVKVQALVRRGASMVLNDIEKHTPALRAMANALREMTGGQVQANLYFSMRQRQAFGPHFDFHDVFAVHCCGEKSWHIYEGSEDVPVRHPALAKDSETLIRDAGQPSAIYDLRPGDLLYIPRGRYHDALASANGAVHVTFGVTMPKPLDLMSALWQCAVMNPKLRCDLALKPDSTALGNAVRRMGKELQRMTESTDVQNAMAEMLTRFASSSDDYDIAALTAEDVRYLVAPGIRLEKKKDKTLLGNGRKWVEVPAGLESPVAWVLQQKDITETRLGAAYSAMNRAEVTDLIGKLRTMNVLT